VHTDNRSVTGRGGLTLIPFLDINFNNVKDDNEPVIPNLDLRINGGRFLDREKDSLTRVMDLEPYSSVLIELNNDGFENIAWQLRDKAMRVYIDPNQFKHIEIPVYPMGEINGMVYIKKGRTLIGQGRILVDIYTATGELVKKIMSERDGYFTFLGLAPGDYYAILDTEQMEKLGWSFQPDQIDFSIQPSEWGDIVDGIDFTITVNDAGDTGASQNENPIKKTSTANVGNNDKPTVRQRSKTTDDAVEKNIIPPTDVQSALSFSQERGIFYVQTASCPSMGIAQQEVAKIAGLTSTCSAGVVNSEGKFKVRLGYFKTRADADACKEVLRNQNVDAFVGTVEDTDKKEETPLPSEEISIAVPFNEQAGNFYVQTASCPSMGIAQQEVAKIAGLTSTCSAGVVNSEGKFKVRLGYFKTRAEADACKEVLRNQNVDAFVGAVEDTDKKEETNRPLNQAGISTELDVNAGIYYVQTASCPTMRIAQTELAKYEELKIYPSGIVAIDDAFKVRFGYFKTKAEARDCFDALKRMGSEAFIGIKNP
ncbi:MAG: SPOR domain-containing protein, partial [Bacteroidales bacterium]|nr:SPOR domain-containing protein [Bacteroidales bacterium]